MYDETSQGSLRKLPNVTQIKVAELWLILGLKIDCTPLTVVILYPIMIAGKMFVIIYLVL